MKNNLEIGNRIRLIREGMNLNRGRFSERVGISEVFLSQIERGEKSLSLNTLINICNNIGCSADFILFGNADENTVVKRTMRMLEELPPDVRDTVYTIIGSLKSIYEKANTNNN